MVPGDTLGSGVPWNSKEGESGRPVRPDRSQTGGSKRGSPWPSIAGYRIEGFLGRGATGTVYSAVQLAVDRPVAIKVLHSELMGTGRAVRRLQREARTAARLAHPGIISAIDMGQEGGRWWYAMELVEGISLAERIAERGPLSEREALRLFCPLCDALQHLYEGGVVHRDIKPANILINQRGRALLVDLGLAHAEDDPSITRSGGTLGTPHYMSPEQARDATGADQRSDIWSLGATLYHALCGKPPFEGESVGEILSGVLYHRVTEPRKLAPHLSRGISLVLRKCLAREPERRYQQPEQLLADLERLRERRTPSVRSDALDPVARQARVWSWKWVAAAVLTAVVLLGIWRPWQGGLGPESPAMATQDRPATWPALEHLQGSLESGELNLAEALLELRILPDTPTGWAVDRAALRQNLLAQLGDQLGLMELKGEAAVLAWLDDHDFIAMRSYLGQGIWSEMAQSTGFARLDELPQGAAGARFRRWHDSAGQRLAREHSQALEAAGGVLEGHIKRVVVPAFNQALQKNAWADCLVIVEHSPGLITDSGADVRGFSVEDTDRVLDYVRADLDVRRSSARNHYLRVDGQLVTFAREEAERLRVQVYAGVLPSPREVLLSACAAEASRLNLVPSAIPVAWRESRGRSTGSARILEELGQQLAGEAATFYGGIAQAALAQDLDQVDRWCSRRRYAEASSFLENRLADEWRAVVHPTLRLRLAECRHLDRLLERTEQQLVDLRGSRRDFTFERISFPGTRIGSAIAARQGGFEVTAPSIGAFRVHIVPPSGSLRGDRVLSYLDLLSLCGLGANAPLAGLSPADQLLRSLFLFHEGQVEAARAGLPEASPESDPMLASLSKRIAGAQETTRLVLERQRQLKENRMAAVRIAHADGEALSVQLERIDDIVDQFAKVLTSADRAELDRIRTQLQAPAEQPSLQEVYGPSQLEYLERRQVRLTWDFAGPGVGAWKRGNWVVYAGGLHVPERSLTDAAFWAPGNALVLPLVEPLDLERPMKFTLQLLIPSKVGGLGNEMVLSFAGVNFVLEDDPSAPAFVVGREGARELLAQVRGGEVSGFSGFGGFALTGDESVEIVVEVHPKLGRFKVTLNGEELHQPTLSRGPLPAQPVFSLRSRVPVDLVRVQLAGERLGNRR